MISKWGELPEWVTVKEFTAWKGQFETVVGRSKTSIIERTIATLQHYEEQKPFVVLGRKLVGGTIPYSGYIDDLCAAKIALRNEEAKAKEPEWFEGPSGTVYQVSGQVLWTLDGDGKSQWATTIPIKDAAFVVKLMEGKNA